MKAREKFFLLLAIVDGESWEPADVAQIIGSTPDYARKLLADLRHSCSRGTGIKALENKNFPACGKKLSSVNP